MSPSSYRGSVRDVYQAAWAIPEVFDSLYCYCGCKANPRFRHKTLLTCYTDDHAANCYICLKEGEMAWTMTQQGKSIEEIIIEIDRWEAKNRLSKMG
jgi:hypothetical protein